MRICVLLVLLAGAASAQPVRADLHPLGPVLGTAPARPEMPPRKVPPVLYGVGVAADVAVLGGGVYLAVASTRAMLRSDEAGLGAPAVLTIGGLMALTGVGAAVLSGRDLAHVARGADPALARLLMTPLPPGPRPPLR